MTFSAPYNGLRTVPLLSDYTWNHTTLWAMKADPAYTYLQCGFDAVHARSQFARLKQRFGDEFLLHIEFIKNAQGVVFPGAIPVVRFTTEKRLNEMIDYCREIGVGVANPHVNNVEGGGRMSDYEHTNFRLVAGTTGQLLDGLTYDAYGSFYYVTLFNSNNNYLNYANIGQALIATGTAAHPVCVNPQGNCVPYNIFTQGGVTAPQLNYLETDGTGYGTTSEGILHADLTADMGKWGITSPMAHEGVGLNVGGEHRYDTLVYTPDAALKAGDLAGFSGAVVPTNAAFDVNEGFLEVRAPIMQDRPFVHDLDVDAGYRYSSYSSVGSTNAYKFEVQYAPLSDFRLRYSYDRAVRAPNLIELYNPPAYAQQSFLGVDPCAGPTPTATPVQCGHTGVTGTQYGSIPQCVAGQCGEVVSGNPALKPEQADTYSVGLTLTPTMLPSFTASIDYWHISFFDLIGVYPGATLFESCLTTGNPLFCSQIVRNNITGALTGATVAGGGYILQKNYNLGSSIESGLDVQASYRLGLGRWGSLTWALNGAYLQHSITTPYPGAKSFDCVGLFGPDCNTNSINPRWRHTLRVSWQTPWDRLLLSANWRFIGSLSLASTMPSMRVFQTTAISIWLRPFRCCATSRCAPG